MEEGETESKRKQSVAALTHLQDYMKAIKHEPSKCKDLEYDHMSHIFGGGFASYMGEHAKINDGEFSSRQDESFKNSVMSRKVARTSTSTSMISQIRSSNESDILLTKFGPSEITQDEIKEVEHQGEFIKFKVIFQHNYYYSNNKNN